MRQVKLHSAGFPLRIAAYAIFFYFFYLMVKITLQYVPISFDVAFLQLKQNVIAFWWYKLAFYIHVYTSIVVLLVGGLQFVPSLRKHLPLLHKTCGKLYIGLILFAAAPSGLVMAVVANGGFWSRVSFVLQSLLWFYFSYYAYITIVKGIVSAHGRYVLRSYALTFSAISLRLIKLFIVTTFALPPLTTYKIVAWAGWLLNLFIVEAFIYFWLSKQKASIKPAGIKVQFQH
jgi:hypothetical protein